MQPGLFDLLKEIIIKQFIFYLSLKIEDKLRQESKRLWF